MEENPNQLAQDIPDLTHRFFENLPGDLKSLDQLIPLILLLLLIFALFFLLIGLLVGKALEKSRMREMIRKERLDAVKKSRAVLGGQLGEQIAPFFPDFPCNPGDSRFLGSPIDYIAFPGSAEGDEIKEILLIEVKSGKSTLSAREKQIRDAVKNGRVRFVEYRIPASIFQHR